MRHNGYHIKTVKLYTSLLAYGRFVYVTNKVELCQLAITIAEKFVIRFGTNPIAITK